MKPLLVALALLASGCAQQEQLKALINMPGQLEQASLIAYRSSLEMCALNESEKVYLECRATIQSSWKPLIELFEKAHGYFCQVLPEHEACKAGK